MDLAGVYHQKGKYEDAITSYQKAIEFGPNYVNAHFSLGNIYIEQGKLDEAISEYQKVIEIDPDNAWAHHNLGLVYWKQDKLDDARKNQRHGSPRNPRVVRGNRRHPRRTREQKSRLFA